MAPQVRHGIPADDGRARANDRFKRRSRYVFWGSVIAAAAIHAAAFWLLPPLSVDAGGSRLEILALEPPTSTAAPPSPPAMPPPSMPGIVGRPGLEEIERPLPPLPQNPLGAPSATFRDIADEPTFTPYEVAPRLSNREQAVAALNRLYPASRRDIAVPLRVRVWFLIDRYGTVRRTFVNESSGFEDVDSAALRAAEIMEFTPAWSRDRRVPVWIDLPIRFELDVTMPVGADTAVAGGAGIEAITVDTTGADAAGTDSAAGADTVGVADTASS